MTVINFRQPLADDFTTLARFSLSRLPYAQRGVNWCRQYSKKMQTKKIITNLFSSAILFAPLLHQSYNIEAQR